MSNFTPQKILVDSSVRDSPVAEAVLSKVINARVEVIKDAESVIKQAYQSRNQGEWRKTLLIARQKGPFLKLCPGTSRHICCSYNNLNVVTNCDLNCTYCILQSYLNNRLVTIYANTSDLWNELNRLKNVDSTKIFRIGTGELTDSLTFEHLYSYSRDLVNYFKDKQHILFELKTKSTQIGNLLNINHNRRTVVSWSVNTSCIAASNEKDAPSLEERFIAARHIQDAGYRLGFHFDPMIWYDTWEKDYRSVVENIFSFAKPENISWISLGGLRYSPELEQIIRNNHPESKIILGELFPGADGKKRYFKPLRIKMFRQMYKWIRECSEEVFVYLCMESDEVWKKAFGWSPKNSTGLARLLDSRVKLP